MGSLSSIYIKRDTLKTLLDVVSKKDLKGIELTISINEETNNYGQNLSSYVAQSKEERDAGKKKFYVGNGKVFWTDGAIKVAEKNESTTHEPTVAEDEDDDLPF